MAIQNLDLEEQEQLDKLRHFWEKWGTLITTVVVLALLAFAGWRGYQWYESNQAVKASALYDQIQADADAGDTAKLANSLKLMQDDFASTTYGQHAGLLAAQVFLEKGQAEQSRAALGMVAEKGPDKGLQGLARLQLAQQMIGEKQFEQAQQQLQQVDASYAALVADLTGDIHTLQNQQPQAIEAYTRAWRELDSNLAYQQMVGIKLTALGVDLATLETPAAAAPASAAAPAAASSATPAAASSAASASSAG
ncbi:YfgM family protein [Brachymonas chironomi]|uniref:YfgM family protein n=1 Tax=Brachymonas chironomi TaxID=491919 RepID=UPI0003686838|nr:tetratricopeptide repeat protein [Brachymonas chironomi]